MYITIKIETGNEAMKTWSDISSAIKAAIDHRIIETRKDQIYPKELTQQIYDYTGNIVGYLKVTK